MLTCTYFNYFNLATRKNNFGALFNLLCVCVFNRRAGSGGGGWGELPGIELDVNRFLHTL